MEIGSEAVETTMYQLQKGSQILTDLNKTPGGSTSAFHKCATQLMSWVETPEFLEIDKNIDQYWRVLEDAVGAKSTIAQLLPHKANKGLGYHFCNRCIARNRFGSQVGQGDHNMQQWSKFYKTMV